MTLVKTVFYFIVVLFSCNGFAEEVEFFSELIDASDHKNINIKNFSNSDYFPPGEYELNVYLNKQDLQEQRIFYYDKNNSSAGGIVCLSRNLVEKFLLKPDIFKKLIWWDGKDCLELTSLPLMKVKTDLSSSSLYISLPQVYLQYIPDNWTPPSLWENGLPGILLDYNINTQIVQQLKNQKQTTTALNGSGVTGINLGSWRARAEWQMLLDKKPGRSTMSSLDWTRYYVYTAIKALGAKFTLGEDYFSSNIFDGFRFTGLSLITDTNMLPPGFRGYAPEVTGVAKSNATVIIRQQGRIISQTQVAAGPFRIQDLSYALIGELNVEVKEQDGVTQTFTVNTTGAPFLTRPGQLRYKLAAGRPTDWRHHVSGGTFASSEFSWGINNSWSFYGGAIAAENYASAAIGIGRDLMTFGALSFDIAHARARLKNWHDIGDKIYRGNAYRLSYSKRFDTYNSQVTFAGQWVADKDFMNMSEYLEAQSARVRQYNSKEMYTISYNQEFPGIGLNAYIDYSHQAYWNRPDNDRYSLSLSRFFSVGLLKNVSLNVAAYRNRYRRKNDDGIYMSLFIPQGEKGSISLNADWNKNNNTQQVTYYGRVNEYNRYKLSTGWARSGALINGNYTHQSDLAQVNINAAYQQNRYRSAGMFIQGGFTATGKGTVMHRNNQLGGTRIFVDADGIPDIPLRGDSVSVRTNHAGQAVLADMNSYYLNQVSVDLNRLSDDAQVEQSVKRGVFTEGAIGYRRFNVVSGRSIMAILRLADNSTPPFGATVFNEKNKQLGIVSDDGNVYLSGLNNGEILDVHWDNKPQCKITLPKDISSYENNSSNILLPCE
ncbi:fimbria/pilus outer membrane usher protein [Enterobacteriaceae bacterium LUAb1]